MTHLPVPDPRPAWHVSSPAPGALLGSAAALILLSLLVRAVNHDESQYVAAIALMRNGLPYRDFAYLQTPLQPLLLSPLSLLPPGWVFVAARAVNGAFGLATLLLIFLALRRRVSARALLLSVGGLACSAAFLLSSSLARNDALAMVLLAAAVAALLAAVERRSALTFALAGLCLGLAASAKISAALLAAGAGLFIIARVRVFGVRSLAGFSLGLAAGLLPTILLAALAPAEFLFDVFGYNLNAPVQWWTYLGEGSELDPGRRVLELIGIASLGSTPVALLASCADRTPAEDRRLLDCMILGGLAAAYLPVPALTQYLVPLLPPLAARFGLALDCVTPQWKRSLELLTALGCAAGLVGGLVVHAAPYELLRSPTLGRRVAALAGGGAVVTLSAEYVAGRGLVLDPRFATGPFLYRTRGSLAHMAQGRGRALTTESFAQALDDIPPRLVFVGGEVREAGPDYPAGLDGPLIAWARSRGYRPVPLGSGFIALVASRGRSLTGRGAFRSPQQPTERSE